MNPTFLNYKAKRSRLIIGVMRDLKRRHRIRHPEALVGKLVPHFSYLDLRLSLAFPLRSMPTEELYTAICGVCPSAFGVSL